RAGRRDARVAVVGAPAFGTQADHRLPVRREAPCVLHPQALQPAPAADLAGDAACRIAAPVAGQIAGHEGEPVLVVLIADIDDVRALDPIGPPGAANGEVDPARARRVG